MNEKRGFFDFARIFLLALALRLILLVAWHSSGEGTHLSGDSPSYLRVAESLSNGLGFSVDGQPSFRRGPGYPLFLALTLHLGFPLSAQILQLILDALSAFFIFKIGVLLWGRRVGVVAGLSYSIYYYAIKQCVIIMPETLFVFFVVLSFYFYYYGRDQQSYKKIVLAGLFASFAVLTKEILVFYYIAWGISTLLLECGKGRRCMMGATALFLGVYILSLAPWILRSSLAHKRFTLWTDVSGFTLYLGNNPTVNPRLKGEDWTLKVNTALPPDVSSDKVHKDAAVQYIKARPRTFVKNALFKLGRFWYPVYSDSPLLIKIYGGLLFIYMVLFGGVGLWQNRKRWVELLPFWGMLVYLSCINSITIASIRYRFVLEPFLLLLAASSAAQIRLHSCLKKAKISPS